MNTKKLYLAAALGLLVGTAALVIGQRALANDDAELAARQQMVVYLTGQQSTAMTGDTVPGYGGGQGVLPYLLTKGWRVTQIYLAENQNAAGYAVLERK